MNWEQWLWIVVEVELKYWVRIMCRYAMKGPYKNHFACFACRKAFKQNSVGDWLKTRGQSVRYKRLAEVAHSKTLLARREEELGYKLSDIVAEYWNATHNCPECKSPMIDMGLDFKAPPKTNTKAWKIIHGMYHAGHAFHTCGCYGPGFIPANTAQYKNYLVMHQRQYAKRLEETMQSTDINQNDRLESVKHWKTSLDKVEVELIKLKRL